MESENSVLEVGVYEGDLSMGPHSGAILALCSRDHVVPGSSACKACSLACWASTWTLYHPFRRVCERKSQGLLEDRRRGGYTEFQRTWRSQ